MAKEAFLYNFLLPTRIAGGFLFRAFALLTHSTRSKDFKSKRKDPFENFFNFRMDLLN